MYNIFSFFKYSVISLIKTTHFHNSATAGEEKKLDDIFVNPRMIFEETIFIEP